MRNVHHRRAWLRERADSHRIANGLRVAPPNSTLRDATTRHIFSVLIRLPGDVSAAGAMALLRRLNPEWANRRTLFPILR